ncbi:MAG: DUF2934 domain-containing protein [Acidobacteriota bacterium]
MRLSPAHPESDRLSLPQIEERIRNRAYEIYLQNGCVEGRALDDWLEAKAEVLGVVAPEANKRTDRKAASSGRFLYPHTW